jgi:hypothetical protein
MLAHFTNFLVGKDRRGRWAVAEGRGEAGGIFASREAALRYARLESGRRPGAVRQTSSPISLALNGERMRGERKALPAGWSVATSKRGFEPHGSAWNPAGQDKRWLILDIALVLGLAALCIAVGLAVA